MVLPGLEERGFRERQRINVNVVGFCQERLADLTIRGVGFSESEMASMILLAQIRLSRASERVETALCCQRHFQINTPSLNQYIAYLNVPLSVEVAELGRDPVLIYESDTPPINQRILLQPVVNKIFERDAMSVGG